MISFCNGDVFIILSTGRHEWYWS